LIEAASRLQLWTGRFDRRNAELLEVRDEITNSIAATLMTTSGEIAKAELTRQLRMAPENFNVYDRYLKARSYFHRSLRPPWHAVKQASDLAKI
jgi:adenylate cyclase